MFAVIHMVSRSAPHRTGRALRQVLCGSRTWGASARAHSMRLRLQQQQKNATQTACASNQFNPSAAIAVALKAHSRTHTHTHDLRNVLGRRDIPRRRFMGRGRGRRSRSAHWLRWSAVVVVLNHSPAQVLVRKRLRASFDIKPAYQLRHRQLSSRSIQLIQLLDRLVQQQCADRQTADMSARTRKVSQKRSSVVVVVQSIHSPIERLSAGAQCTRQTVASPEPVRCRLSPETLCWAGMSTSNNPTQTRNHHTIRTRFHWNWARARNRTRTPTLFPCALVYHIRLNCAVRFDANTFHSLNGPINPVRSGTCIVLPRVYLLHIIQYSVDLLFGKPPHYHVVLALCACKVRRPRMREQ